MGLSPTEVCSTTVVKLQFGALIFDKKNYSCVIKTDECELLRNNFTLMSMFLLSPLSCTV